MQQERGAILDCFLYFKGNFLKMHHVERDSESWGGGWGGVGWRGSWIQSCAFDLNKLTMGWSSMHFPHGTCQQYEWPFKKGHTRINPLKQRLHVCLHGIDFAVHRCHSCWQALVVNDDLFSDCTRSMTWQIAVKFMYGFPWWCTF